MTGVGGALKIVPFSKTSERPHSRQRILPRRVVLAIGAHPDDVEIGVGGILCKHTQLGDRVAILTLSGGAAGGKASNRIREAELAAAKLGAELYLGDLPDTRISDGIDTIRTLERTIAKVRPSIVYTHSVHDAHQDHRSTHTATLVAARTVPRIFAYQTPSATIDFRPNRFVPIDHQFERKLELIEAYASQTSVRPYLSADLLRSNAAYWGRYGNYRLVEPLEVVREIDQELSTDDIPVAELAACQTKEEI